MKLVSINRKRVVFNVEVGVRWLLTTSFQSIHFISGNKAHRNEDANNTHKEDADTSKKGNKNKKIKTIKDKKD